MKLFVNMTTRIDNHENQISNINYDQNLMTIIKKIIKTKSNSHQIKHEQNKFSYTSLEKMWDLSSMRLGNQPTQKRAKRGEL